MDYIPGKKRTIEFSDVVEEAIIVVTYRVLMQFVYFNFPYSPKTTAITLSFAIINVMAVA